MKTASTFRSGFTLIELLIVVAIIAILAAIAVPNFLEAQTRAKVSRLVSDFRTFKVGLESYRVDTNKYPETDTGRVNQTATSNKGAGMHRLTSPIAYITSISRSPFKEDKIGSPAAGQEQFAVLNVHPLYVRALDLAGTAIDPNYISDREAYLILPNLPGNQGRRLAGDYEIKSVGPDNIDNRDTNQYIFTAFSYDPTNGTLSDGDLVTFSDTSINAGAK